MKKSSRFFCALIVLAFAPACGLSAEEKALKKERVDLLVQQHTALRDGNQECAATQQRLDDFDARDKTRIATFNTKWVALGDKKRKQLMAMEPFSGKEVDDALIAVAASCAGIRRPIMP